MIKVKQLTHAGHWRDRGEFANLQECYSILGIDKQVIEFSEEFYDKIYDLIEAIGLDEESDDALKIVGAAQAAVLNNNLFQWINWKDCELDEADEDE